MPGFIQGTVRGFTAKQEQNIFSETSDHKLTFYLTCIPSFYLRFFLAFYPTDLLIMYPDILSGIPVHLTFYLASYLHIFSGALFDFLSGIPFWHLSWHSI